MPTFIQVSDPLFPSMSPWWVMLLPRGDLDSLFNFHKGFSRQFWVLDGRDPHNQTSRDKAAREGTFSIADLCHPLRLSQHWITTASHLFKKGDVLIAPRGGMRPRDGTLTELAQMESKDWPPTFNAKHRITLTTWGKHWYLVSHEIAFSEKYDSEQAAMDVAKRFAPAENITVKREARDYREGD